MKLKKIASLMLAGIMAVSMLAGCKSGNATNEEPENPVTPTGTSIADYVNGMLSEDVAKNVKFVDDAELRAALTTVAGKASNVNSSMIQTTNKTVDATSTGGNQTLAGKVKDEFTSGVIATNSLSAWMTSAPADKSGVDSYLNVYVLDGDMTEMNVADAVFDGWNTYLGGMTSTTVSGKKCDWSGSVSAVKVYDNTDPDESAWIVGVIFTTTVSDIANTVK